VFLYLNFLEDAHRSLGIRKFFYFFNAPIAY